MDPVVTGKERAAPRVRALGVAGAVLAAAAVWTVAVLAGADLLVSFGPGQPELSVTLPWVIMVSLLSALAGWALLSLLERVTPRAMTVWTVAAVTVAALSLAGPLSSTAPVGTKASLIAMHLAVAGALILALRRTRRGM